MRRYVKTYIVGMRTTQATGCAPHRQRGAILDVDLKFLAQKKWKWVKSKIVEFCIDFVYFGNLQNWRTLSEDHFSCFFQRRREKISEKRKSEKVTDFVGI